MRLEKKTNFEPWGGQSLFYRYTYTMYNIQNIISRKKLLAKDENTNAHTHAHIHKQEIK